MSNEVANQARETMENLLRARNAFAIVTEEKGVIVQTNELFTEITGYSQEELIGKTHNV